MSASDAKQKQSRRPRRKFTREFKDGAVKLVLDEDKGIPEVAKDLDLTESVLRTWVERAKEARGEGRPGMLLQEEREELALLRAENRQLRMERELLKKLHRQIWPELRFDGSEVGVRVGAEASAHDARHAPLFKLGA
nr:transposase [Pyxidicoccus caerfyrddinensis]